MLQGNSPGGRPMEAVGHPSSKNTRDCAILDVVKRQVVNGTPEMSAPAEQVRRRIRTVAIVAFLIAEAGLVLAVTLDAVISDRSFVVPLIEAIILTVVFGAIIYYSYRYSTRMSASETARAEAEEKLREVRENEHVLLNAPHASAFLLDLDGNILAINEMTASVFGSTPDELVGSSLLDILPVEVTASHEGLKERLVDRAETVLLTEKVLGQYYTYSVVPVTDGKGRVARLAVFALDVTDQVETHRKLKASEGRYKSLFESSFDGIVFSDLAGKILACNESFAHMLGYEVEELVGTDVWRLTPDEWRSVDEEVIEHQLKTTGYSDRYEKQYRRKDGSLVPVNLRVWTSYDESGRPEGAWCRVEDMSQRKQYEDFIRQTIVRLEQANDRLREVDRLKTEFVGIVSHELRSPIAAVESGLSALKALSATASEQERAELLAIADRGVKRLGHLVDDLLDISRIESGQLKLELEEVDAAELVRRVIDAYASRYSSKGVELGLEHEDGACRILCDGRRIEQVLTNRVDNALKFTDEGSVVVRLDHTPSRLICSVTDTGTGLPPGLQQQVFEKFYTVGSPGGTQGVGLGLAISKGIIEAHGGRMWVESRKGSGATFGFEVPS